MRPRSSMHVVSGIPIPDEKMVETGALAEAMLSASWRAMRKVPLKGLAIIWYPKSRSPIGKHACSPPKIAEVQLHDVAHKV